MTLSVCCLTSDPGARVAAILRQLRPVADEIVVAVDSRVDPGRLGRYEEVADRLLRFEFVDSAEQAAHRVVSECRGEWILRIDGDELLTPALIERLPELTRSRELFQYWLSCRWLYPDAEHYIAQPPWHYISPRLVRNDPATLWHAGLSHGRFEPVFPAAHLSEGYYHLSLLVNDLAYREAKVEHYLSIRTGHSRSVLERDVTAFYLPERDRTFGGVDPVPVPAGDRAAIAEVLGARGEELPTKHRAQIPLLSWSEIQRVWPPRTLSADAYRGEIHAYERPPVLAPGERRALTVRVANGGGEAWPGMGREPAIELSHRWVHAGHHREPAAARHGEPGEWLHTPLPAALAPGSSALVPVAVEAPARAGEHALELTLVHLHPRSGEVLARFAAATLPVHVVPAAARTGA